MLRKKKKKKKNSSRKCLALGHPNDDGVNRRTENLSLRTIYIQAAAQP